MRNITVIFIASEYVEESILSIESILMQEKDTDIKIIIFDAVYRSDMAEFSQKKGNTCYVVPEDCNIPVGKSFNDIIVNNDVEDDVCFYFGGYLDTDCALYKMIIAFDECRSIGIASGVSNIFSEIQHCEAFKNYAEMRSFSENADNIAVSRVLSCESDIVMISSDSIKKVGKFDEKLETVDAVLRDYIFRASVSEIGIGIIKNSMFWGLRKNRTALNKENRYFLQKYNISEFDYKYDAHVVESIRETPGQCFNVLEFGCGCGANLLEIRRRYANSNIFGVEKNENLRMIASGFANMIVLDGDNSDSVLSEGFFDYIIVGKVLETVNDYNELLKWCKKYLKETGTIVSYVNNPLFVSNIEKILWGGLITSDDSNLKIPLIKLDDIEVIFRKFGFVINNVSFDERYISELEKEIVNRLSMAFPDIEKEEFEISRYYYTAIPSYNIMLPQGAVDILSKVKYHDVFIYRYLVDVLVLFDSEDEVRRNMEMSSERRTFEAVGNRLAAESAVNTFLSSLRQSDILVVNISGRKVIKDEEYLTVLDPYIDAIEGMDYLVVDISGKTGDGEYPTHTKNIHFCPGNDILSAFGVEDVDYDDLSMYMEKAFFAELENYIKRNLYPDQKQGLVNIVYYALSIRNAFWIFYEKVLSVVRPQKIIYSHGGNSKITLLYEVAQMKGIPCVEIDHGANKYQVNQPETSRHRDILVTYSDFLERESRKYGVDSIVAIGKPYHIEKGNNYISTKSETVLVCIISSVEEGLLLIAETLSEILPVGKYAVIYKKHLAERIEDEWMIKAKYPNLTVIGGDGDVNTLFERSQIVIGHRSTALLEALVYEKIKIILVGEQNDYESDSIFSHFGDMIDLNEMVYAETIDDIVDEIISYRKGGSYRQNGEYFWKQNAENNFRELIADLGN